MAIEARQFTDKDELIANFYALRAGLSVIAEETEKITDVEKKICEARVKNNRENEKYLNGYLHKKDEELRKIHQEQWDVERRIKDKENEMASEKRSLEWSLDIIKFSTVIL